MPCAPTIRLELRPSRLQFALVLALAGAAVLALLLAPWPGWLRGVAVALVLGLAALPLARAARPPASLEWRGDGGWLLQPAGARSEVPTDPIAVRLGSARVIGPLMALDLRGDAGRHRINLWPDSADPAGLRRLRIRLLRLAADADADADANGRQPGRAGADADVGRADRPGRSRTGC